MPELWALGWLVIGLRDPEKDIPKIDFSKWRLGPDIIGRTWFPELGFSNLPCIHGGYLTSSSRKTDTVMSDFFGLRNSHEDSSVMSHYPRLRKLPKMRYSGMFLIYIYIYIIGMLVSFCRFHTSNFFFGTHYSYRSTKSYGATRSLFGMKINESTRI